MVPASAGMGLPKQFANKRADDVVAFVDEQKCHRCRTYKDDENTKQHISVYFEHQHQRIDSAGRKPLVS